MNPGNVSSDGKSCPLFTINVIFRFQFKSRPSGGTLGAQRNSQRSMECVPQDPPSSLFSRQDVCWETKGRPSGCAPRRLSPWNDISHQRRTPSPYFPATFHYPRHTNLFHSSTPHFPGALTRETRPGVAARRPLFPFDLYQPRRRDVSNNGNFRRGHEDCKLPPMLDNCCGR